MATLQEIITNNRAWSCLDCGKCSAVCPITLWEKQGYRSPRLMVEAVVEGRSGEVLDDILLWNCLTCKRCSTLCPSDVHFSEFVRDMRGLAQAENRIGGCTHGDAISTWGRMMAVSDLEQDRLGWLDSSLRTSASSDTVYFVGCLPYYDVLFNNLGIEGIEIARSALKILNYLGIEPQVLADEVCCGHDQLWMGETGTFRSLAARNLEQLKASGARRVVTTCPECARTLKIDYPQLAGDHGLEVLHIAELLEGSDLSALMSSGQSNQGCVTYQDPCRLGRHMGVYDAPRTVLAALGFELREMAHTRQASLCCGTSCWTHCGQVSKNIQVERLSEAKATGAQLLVTACVKCQIHFKCAQADPALGDKARMEIRDLTTMVAGRLP